MSADPDFPPKGQLHELTSTRFFAAMAVLLGHFTPFGIPPAFAMWFAGGFGVSFFFVLSVFILCYRYWDTFAQGVHAPEYKRYFVARIARVYPSYAMALVLITLLYVAMNAVRPGAYTYPPNTLSSWLVNLAALQTFAPSYATQQYWNAPGWSISTEFAFYFACPAILAAIARWAPTSRRLGALLALTVLAGIAMQLLALGLVFRFGWDRQLWLDVVASRNIFWRFPEFLTGVVAARLLYGGHLAWLADVKARHALLIVSFMAVLLLNVAPWPSDTVAVFVMRQLRLDVAYMLPFGGIVLALAAGPTVLSPLLRRPSWVFLGDISYAIYIYHWIPWTVLSHAQAAGFYLPLGLVTGVVVVTILFSAASYIWFEKPARRLIRSKFGQ